MTHAQVLLVVLALYFVIILLTTLLSHLAHAQEIITSYEEFEAHHALALRNRTTAPTLLNAHSSRSHFMVMVKVCPT
jgi:hypothetical protein